MPSAAKAKGNSFERELADHLSRIFGYNFQRTPNSGAYSSFANAHRRSYLTPAQNLLASGDLIVPEQLSKFTFECKFYKEFSWHQLLSENKQLDKWIEQARNCDKIWFLCVKINRQGVFVCFDNDHLVKTLNYVIYKGCNIVPLDNFFETNKEKMLTINGSDAYLINAVPALSNPAPLPDISGLDGLLQEGCDARNAG